ncbi:hypothetical protein PSV6_2 [Pseudomonas phage PSV6]|nr:hypothetical protein PSV6_2 [Pseudomonas phage PSV6]
MARKVTQQAVNAFIAGRTGVFGGNTVVELSPLGEVLVMKLHGNAIARRDVGPFGTFEVRDGGWQSNTTKERLNGLPGVSVNQKQYVWFLNGAAWDGHWTLIAQ